jgi:thioesterase domain-containing protein
MAQQLKAQGANVALLALLDTTLPDPRGPRTASEELVVLDLASALGIADLVGRKRPLPSLAELVDIAHRAGRLPLEVHIGHVERIADVIRNTVRTCPDYRLRHWNGPTLLLRATKRHTPMVDWTPYVSARALTVVDLDCTHPDLIAPQMAPKVAALIARHMVPATDVDQQDIAQNDEPESTEGEVLATRRPSFSRVLSYLRGDQR